ncbi:MAG: thiol reductase thioredoxin [Deltaproteobacteria bacterium]|nr:thiol reductase thioredoxin [Deltaproteobacteria bacterium]
MAGNHTGEMTEKNFEATLAGHDIVLIDFWASWCGPCKAFAPIFEKVATKHPDIVFAKVDTEAEAGLAGAFSVRSIPTLAIFRDKVLLFLQPGAVLEEALEDLIVQVRGLDMDKVREEIAQHAAEHPHEEGCQGCGHDHDH